jgi:CubicO group peptidase (beta-lactamase class C family)
LSVTATIRDLLRARSGVYHAAANAGDASARAPARGSVKPGQYFLYNNWDFNALGALFEKITGRNLYTAFGEDIARPIGCEDWDEKLHAQAVRNDTGASSWPAQHFVLSTRDMARVGQLMLNGGRWGDAQVIPRHWVSLTTSIATPAVEVARTSPFVDGLAYGYLWWIFDPAAQWPAAMKGGYTASGAFGTVHHRLAQPEPGDRAQDTGAVELERYARALFRRRRSRRRETRGLSVPGRQAPACPGV